MQFSTYSDVLSHLDRLGMFHMDFGLERMERALDSLGLTRHHGGLAPSVVQIVGTNGKGSTATFLASLAQAHGLRVGLYTSPHLARVNERIRIDGIMLADDAWPALASEVYGHAPELTYFEFLTVLAVLAFTRANVDVMVLEAGLGGRYDATTAVDADMLCITPISFDHVNILGPTLGDIAKDKACAMRPGMPVITVAQVPEALAPIMAVAKERGCSLQQAGSLHVNPVKSGGVEPVVLSLEGRHQSVNAGLALTAWRSLARENGWHSEPGAERKGLESAFIPGRLQFIPAHGLLPGTILDGAHNPHGLASLVEALENMDMAPRAVIFTCLEDKDDLSIMPLIKKLSAKCHLFVPDIPGNPRARKARELVKTYGMGHACRNLEAAYGLAAAVPVLGTEIAHRPVVICGSLYLLGEFFKLYPEYLDPGSLSKAHA